MRVFLVTGYIEYAATDLQVSRKRKARGRKKMRVVCTFLTASWSPRHVFPIRPCWQAVPTHLSTCTVFRPIPGPVLSSGPFQAHLSSQIVLEDHRLLRRSFPLCLLPFCPESSLLRLPAQISSHLRKCHVTISRKAFRLGKFVQDVNALRAAKFDSREDVLLSIVAYGGEGLYYFVEQFVWLSKSGLIDGRHARWLGKISAWAEFVGYVGSISLKFRDLKMLSADEACLETSIEVAVMRGNGCREEEERLRKVREKKLMKKLSIVQDFADGAMAVADIQDGKGPFSGPLLVACAGMLSALISTHKNWISC